ncbi:MAG: hypothetical protein AMS15_01635 [Planctomycetes bacterium DG_23]|nr:MAG: hypothetical protein AMS15_01635 [Planctomycetes bacterium DG_23]
MGQTTLIRGASVVTPTGILPETSILVEGEKISTIRKAAEKPTGAKEIDAQGLMALPGFIDVHIQGTMGRDVWEEEDEALVEMCRGLVRFGTTSFVATTHYTPSIVQRINRVMQRPTGGANILGIHLETPFVSEERRGAIPTERLEPPSRAKLDEILTECAGNLRIFTLAPELPGALELFPELLQAGVIISLGHTDATYEEAQRAIALGASHVTHLFNAMRPFYHREPGVIGAIFDAPEVSVQIIADGVHLHPATLRLAFALKGREKIALITDAVRGAGIDQKVFLSSSIRRRVEVKEGAPRLSTGQIAGSILTMDKAVKNIQDFVGASLVDAAFMASTTPARILKLDQKIGSIELGKDADIVLMNEAGEVQMTLIKGEVVYDARKN